MALLPAAVFTQNWAWALANKMNGLAFLVIWGLIIANVWNTKDKNVIKRDLFRATEIGFFLLPLSAIILMITLGYQYVSTTSGAAQAGAAIGTAIGGTLAVGLGFVIGLFGGLIMHLLSSKYAKRIKTEPELNVHPTSIAMNSWEKRKTPITFAILVILVFVALGSGQYKEVTTKNSSATLGSSPTVSGSSDQALVVTKVQEASPLEVVSTSVTSDSIGTPKANVTVKNISTKIVDAYKVHIKTFNSFGEPANGFLTNNNYDGISQDIKVAPGKTDSSSWALYNYDTTRKIEAAPYQVHFTDGTTWEAK